MSKNLGIIILVLVLIGGYFLLSRNKYVPKEETMPNTREESESDIKVTPIEHATMMLEWAGKVIYTDPVGAEKFADMPKADLVLLTDIHGDHLDFDAIRAVSEQKTLIIAPQAVYDEFRNKKISPLGGGILVMNNGERLLHS